MADDTAVLGRLHAGVADDVGRSMIVNTTPTSSIGKRVSRKRLRDSLLYYMEQTSDVELDELDIMNMTAQAMDAIDEVRTTYLEIVSKG
jgi:hypothetical protein